MLIINVTLNCEERVTMWGDILLTLTTFVFEMGFSHFTVAKERKGLKNKLENIIDDLFEDFCDTSIDTDEFYNTINNYKFKELLQNYFYTLRDNTSGKEYRNKILEYVNQQCPKASHSDVKRFFEKIDEFYINHLHSIIEKDPKLNALFQLLTDSNRSIITKLSEKVDEIIKFVDSQKNTSIAIDKETICEYHRVSEKNYRIVRFTGIAGAERKEERDINDVYIENRFSLYNAVSHGSYNDIQLSNDDIKLNEIFDFGNKVILIGGAGFGKTTTLNYLYCNYESVFSAYPLKIKIDLKNFAEEISANGNILNCIAKQFYNKTKRGSCTLEEIEKLLSEFLAEGKCFVIFDALDEIATQNARDAVRDEIANFCELYYLNRYIISTREVGYLKNKFDNSFIHLRVKRFNLEQICAYSKNWYDNYYKDCTEDTFEEFWDKFFLEAKKARCTDLIRNPIILILALVVFDVDENLPNKRIEFYRKCIKTFLFQREDRKAIRELSKNAKNILKMDTTLPGVAHYKYKKTLEDLSYKFNDEELKKSVFSAIEVSDVINWTSAVDEYIDYLLTRTELIAEINDGILDFAHKTFYEYFLALYFSNQMDTQILQRQLYKWIGDANNHELAQLIIEKLLEGSDTEKKAHILEYLFKSVSEGTEKRFSKREDVLHLLTELYNGNILPLKHYDDYYKTILFNGDLLYYSSEVKRRKDIIKYDETELASVFTQFVKTDEELLKCIESLYFLNKKFKKNVMGPFYNRIMLKNIFDLFALCNDSDKEGILTDKECKKFNNVIKYFMSEGYDILVESPLLFSVLVSNIFKFNYQDKCDLEKLLVSDSNVNRYYFNYSQPVNLIALIEYSMNNKIAFALLLLVITIYSHRGANCIFGYVLKTYNSNPKSNYKIADFMYWLWQCLNNNNEYAVFLENLKETELYSEKYEDIYYKTFTAYISEEIEHEDNRIQEFIDEIQK